MELTLIQSIKVLFSYIWRGTLLTVLVTTLMGLVVFFIFGSKTNINLSESFLTLFLCFLLSIITNALALRWALAAEWSDFKFKVIPTKNGINQSF